MKLRILKLCLALCLFPGLAAVPVQAGSFAPGSALSQPPIAPGLSQDCIDKLDPKLRGAAANRAARACRHPSGPPFAAKAPAEAVPASALAPADAVAAPVIAESPKP
ncbi:MAG: hypothetical protein NVS9B10_06840 [Nevskia sp.]